MTITSSDSGFAGQGTSNNGESGLSGGQIAGIAVGTVAGSLLLLALFACLFLRQRRRSKQRAYEVTEIPPNADMTMVGGPAYNSSAPYSSADVSGWSPSTSSPRRPVLADASNTSSPTPELEGNSNRIVPGTEIDGREIGPRKHPFAQSPGVYELAGSKVGNDKMGRPDEPDTSTGSNMSAPSSHSCSDESPPSPFVSTIGTSWDPEGRLVSEMVSPLNPHSH